MPTAIDTQTLPSKIARREQSAKAAARNATANSAQAQFEGKKFAELSQPAKDALLKVLALKFGLIEPD